jgi:hypothetical protein
MTNQRRRREQEDKEKGPTAELEDEEDHEEFNRQVQQAVQAMPVEERRTKPLCGHAYARPCCIALVSTVMQLPCRHISY